MLFHYKITKLLEQLDIFINALKIAAKLVSLVPNANDGCQDVCISFGTDSEIYALLKQVQLKFRSENNAIKMQKNRMYISKFNGSRTLRCTAQQETRRISCPMVSPLRSIIADQIIRNMHKFGRIYSYKHMTNSKLPKFHQFDK